MRIHDYKMIYVTCKTSESDGLELCEEFIKELIKEDKRNDIQGKIYVSYLNAFNWIFPNIDKDEHMKWRLKLLSRCEELYVTPGWEDSKEIHQEIALANYLGLSIRYI